MKGVELPINILVVVAIAVIVLLGLIALYFVGWSPFPNIAGLEGTKNEACRKLVQTYSCAVEPETILVANFDANKNGVVGGLDVGIAFDWTIIPIDVPTDPEYYNNPALCGVEVDATDSLDNLAAICYCHYSKVTAAECKKMCGCP